MITDAGSQARTSPHGEAPAQRLVELRATLLGGRGPGASEEEVTDHTRNRSWLGAVPAPVERALVERQTQHVRAGAPIVNRRVLRQERSRSLRAALIGAVVALAGRAIAVRFSRTRRRRGAARQ
jgi:hypothetical protein